jgi:hypothetical protein
MTGVEKVPCVIIGDSYGYKPGIMPNYIVWKGKFLGILCKNKDTRRKALKRKKIPADIGKRMFLMFQSLDNFKFTSKKP